MTVFIDTSAFLAYLNRADRYNASAVSMWQALLHDEERILCNNYVLVETIALLQQRFGLDAVRTLQDNILPLVATSWLDESDHRQAVTTLLTANRRQLSLVDCSTIVTLRALGIKRVFTFDAHFDDYGFERVPQ